jgi:hypothetical protein
MSPETVAFLRYGLDDTRSGCRLNLHQPLGEPRRRRIPVCRQLGKGSRDRLLDRLGNIGSRRAYAWHGIHRVTRQQLVRGCTRERRMAHQHFIDHAAEAVHIGTTIHLIRPVCLLGTHVCGRAHRQACRRHTLLARHGHRPRYPEIRHTAWPRDHRIFAGLMSRWTTPCSCAYARASATCVAMPYIHQW